MTNTQALGFFKTLAWSSIVLYFLFLAMPMLIELFTAKVDPITQSLQRMQALQEAQYDRK